MELQTFSDIGRTTKMGLEKFPENIGSVVFFNLFSNDEVFFLIILTPF